MLSPVVAVAFVIAVLASEVAAHNFDWVKSLDDCWQSCLANSGNGCKSEKCICTASQDDDYLTDAVSCMRTGCDAGDWDLGIFLLGPLDMWCGLAGQSIPDDIISSAYACATATATATSAAAILTTPAARPSKSSSPQTTDGGDSITATSTSTFTSTTTDSDGHTIALIVPIIIGPGTISYGSTVTSTISGSATTGPTSASASPSATAGITSPTSTQEQGQAASSTTSSKAAKKTSNSNDGSPFENMQAGAERYSFSGPLIGLGAAAGLFLGL